MPTRRWPVDNLRRTRWATAFVAVLLATCGASLQAAPTLTLELVGGRKLTGQVDPRTGEELLWLRFAKGRIVIRRPIAWAQVAQAELDGEAISTHELRNRLIGDLSIAPETVQAPAAESLLLVANSERTVEREATSPVAAPETFAAVGSIGVEASVANWNQSVENDGLLVYIYPLDAQGNLVPTSGTLEIELIGEGPGGTTQTQSFPTLGRWTLMLRPQDLTPRGYVLRLPFQAIHPEFNLQVGPAGLVHAQLAVPGTGVFEATTGTISVRPINPLRDRLQVQQGSRFLPNERTSRGVQPAIIQP